MGACARTTPAPTAARCTRSGLLLRASASRTTAPAASARTSARTPAPRRTGCASRARRGPTSRRSSASTTTPAGRLGRAEPPHHRRALRRGHRRRRHRQPPVAHRPTRRRSLRSQHALADTELLIADGHHRYETARAYADEVGGEGPHRYVLMCLVALQDPGLTVFPTHRLVRGLDDPRAGGARRRAAPRLRHRARSSATTLAPARRATAARPRLHRHPLQAAFRLTLKDQAIADARAGRHARALPPPRHRRARGAAAQGRHGLTDDDIAHLNGLGYARDDERGAGTDRRRRRTTPRFFMRPTPGRARCATVAAAGVNMPPKSHVLLLRRCRPGCCSTRCIRRA